MILKYVYKVFFFILFSCVVVIIYRILSGRFLSFDMHHLHFDTAFSCMVVFM